MTSTESPRPIKDAAASSAMKLPPTTATRAPEITLARMRRQSRRDRSTITCGRSHRRLTIEVGPKAPLRYLDDANEASPPNSVRPGLGSRYRAPRDISSRPAGPEPLFMLALYAAISVAAILSALLAAICVKSRSAFISSCRLSFSKAAAFGMLS
jgi:hypothetical protein